MQMLGRSIRVFDRAANRAKRQMIARVPPVNAFAQHRYADRVRRHRSMVPGLSRDGQDVVRILHTDGVYLGTFNGPHFPEALELRNGLDQLVAALTSQHPDAGSSTLRPTTEQLLEDPALWRWGLSAAMLDLVENYLGVPVRYYGADVRREVADSEAKDVRQWHRDIEDRRMVKILVWLNDVDAGGGPFAYLPVHRSEEVARRLHYVGGFVSDARMRGLAPDREWLTATGPKWTVVMPDTARLMHRATPPTDRDRYSVTFTWTTRHPVKTIPYPPPPPAHRRRLTAGLSPRQLACLPKSFVP